jgi:hypothetical protein
VRTAYFTASPRRKPGVSRVSTFPIPYPGGIRPEGHRQRGAFQTSKPDIRERFGFAVKARRVELELKPALVGLITQSWGVFVRNYEMGILPDSDRRSHRPHELHTRRYGLCFSLALSHENNALPESIAALIAAIRPARITGSVTQPTVQFRATASAMPFPAWMRASWLTRQHTVSREPQPRHAIVTIGPLLLTREAQVPPNAVSLGCSTETRVDYPCAGW